MGRISPQYLVEITEKLDSTGVSWGIFAGAAACAYGVTRPIKDIDILIPNDGGDRIASVFPKAEIERDADGRIAVIQLPDIEIIAGLTRNICLEMDAEMCARVLPHDLLGVKVQLLPLEDNLVFKAILSRGPEMGKHDWSDIAEMLACAECVDWDYVRWRLQQCAPEQSFQIMEKLFSSQRK